MKTYNDLRPYYIPFAVMAVLTVAVLGYRSFSTLQFDIRSQAATLNATHNQKKLPILVSTTSVTVTLDRNTAQSGLVYGPGFTITSQGATAWQIKYTEPTQGQGFYESSGGISPGTSTSIRTYINTSKANGTYTGSAVVQYYLNNKWYDGPTVRYTITVTGGTITVNTTSVVVTLDRSQAISGLVYGPGFTITSQGATAWQIKYTEPTQGQGFYESSGGISPGGSSPIRTYINTNKVNGVYTGSAVVQYYLNGVWADGPTVRYTITLQ